jgi:hypothetical protein
MAIEHEGDAGVERGIGEVAPPCTRHRDVDIGRGADQPPSGGLQ